MTQSDHRELRAHVDMARPFTKQELKTISDARSLIQCALVSMLPSTSLMGSGMMPDDAEAIYTADAASPALAIAGLEWLGRTRRDHATREHETVEHARTCPKIWGNSTAEIIDRFTRLSAESDAKADQYFELARRLRGLERRERR